MTYDPKRMEYRQWYFDADNPTSLGEDRGQSDAAVQTMTWKGKLDDGVTTETVERFTDKDNFTWTFVAKDSVGQVVLKMDARYAVNSFRCIEKSTATETEMRNLFQTGAVFFILAGILFLITAAKYLMTDNGSTVTSGGAVAVGVVMLVLGLVIRSRNTK